MRFLSFLKKLVKTNEMRDHTTNKPYEEIIKGVIKGYKSVASPEVNNLKMEGNSNFYPDKLEEIIGLVKKLGFKTIENKFLTNPKTFEDLSYFSFSNEFKKRYVAIIYDSDELYQDPQILEIVEIDD